MTFPAETERLLGAPGERRSVSRVRLPGMGGPAALVETRIDDVAYRPG